MIPTWYQISGVSSKKLGNRNTFNKNGNKNTFFINNNNNNSQL